MAEVLAVLDPRSGGGASIKTLVPRAANFFGLSGVRPTTEEILIGRLVVGLGRVLLSGAARSLETAESIDEDAAVL